MNASSRAVAKTERGREDVARNQGRGHSILLVPVFDRDRSLLQDGRNRRFVCGAGPARQLVTRVLGEPRDLAMGKGDNADSPGGTGNPIQQVKNPAAPARFPIDEHGADHPSSITKPKEDSSKDSLLGKQLGQKDGTPEIPPTKPGKESGPKPADDALMITDQDHPTRQTTPPGPPALPEFSTKSPAEENASKNKNGQKSTAGGPDFGKDDSGKPSTNSSQPEATKNGRPEGAAGLPRPAADSKNPPPPAAPAPDFGAISTQVPGLTGKPKDETGNTRGNNSSTAPANVGKAPSPAIEFPPLPPLKNSTAVGGTGSPSTNLSFPDNRNGSTTPASPNPNAALGGASLGSTKETPTALGAPAFPESPGTNPATSPGGRSGPTAQPLGAGSPAPSLDLNAGLIKPSTTPGIKPLGADQGATAPAKPDFPALPPLGAPKERTAEQPGGAQLSMPAFSSPQSTPQTPQPTPIQPSSSPGGSTARTQPALGSTGTAATTPITLPAPPASARQPAESEPQVEAYDEESYVWQPNDSFRTLSQQHYQSDKYERALVLFNRNHPLAKDNIRQEPPQLQPGQEVYIPPKRILEKYYAIGIGSSNTTPQPAAVSTAPYVPVSSAPAAPARQPVPNNQRTYRVQGDGEMILDIARRAPRRFQPLERDLSVEQEL